MSTFKVGDRVRISKESSDRDFRLRSGQIVEILVADVGVMPYPYRVWFPRTDEYQVFCASELIHLSTSFPAPAHAPTDDDSGKGTVVR